MVQIKGAGHAVSVEASRLLSDPKVSLRVAGLGEQHLETHGETVASIAQRLREDRDLARKLNNPSAAISATMGLAKLYGLLSNKVEVGVNSDLASAIDAARDRTIAASRLASIASKYADSDNPNEGE